MESNDEVPARDGEPVALLIAELRAILGAQLTAYIAGVNDTHTLRLWSEGATPPPQEVARRLVLASWATHALLARESAGTVRAWWTGLNPVLGDVSPAGMVRNATADTAHQSIRAAVRSFLAHG